MSSEFSQYVFYSTLLHWKKVAVLGIAALVGTGYYIGRESATPAPAPAAVTANETQTLFNLRAKEAFANLGLKTTSDPLVFEKIPACGADEGANFSAATAAGKTVSGTVCMTKTGQAKVTVTP
ncbi:MAG: hypothetical protein EPN97_00615 [Alphaproteobacteria bacterium]|nr:MAG: hypothetical protein EPN97_00615 [Alphaproteobacteria bacterium]